MRRRQVSGRVSESELDGLVSAIYDAALGSVTWEDVLPSVVRFLGGERGAFAARARISDAALVLHHNTNTELFERWASEFSCHDPWLERFAERMLPGELLHAGSKSFLADVRETEVYDAFFGPAGIDDMIAATLSVRGTRRAYMGVYRSRDEGLFDETDLARARLLTPHLVRAAAIHDRIGALGGEAAAAESVLECIPYGVLVLDSRGALLWASRRGESFLRGDGSLVLRAGAVRARDPRVDAALVAACATAARAAPEAISIPAIATRHRLELLVIPVGPRTGATAFAFTPRRASVALVVADPTAADEVPAEVIAEVLQLPPALARLASALSGGKTVVEYAAEAGVTEGTARQQLKDLLARGGVRRQADLIRILQRSVAALSLPEGAAD